MNRSYYANESRPESSDQLYLSSLHEDGQSSSLPPTSSSSSGYGFTKGSIQERHNLVVSVQSGIPEHGALIFNVHIWWVV